MRIPVTASDSIVAFQGQRDIFAVRVRRHSPGESSKIDDTCRGRYRLVYFPGLLYKQTSVVINSTASKNSIFFTAFSHAEIL